MTSAWSSFLILKARFASSIRRSTSGLLDEAILKFMEENRGVAFYQPKMSIYYKERFNLKAVILYLLFIQCFALRFENAPLPSLSRLLNKSVSVWQSEYYFLQRRLFF
jgi:hypothetical protein